MKNTFFIEALKWVFGCRENNERSVRDEMSTLKIQSVYTQQAVHYTPPGTDSPNASPVAS